MAIMPPTREYRSSVETGSYDKIEFDLLDLLIVMAERKGYIALFTLIGFAVALILVLLKSPTYSATTIIMPPQQGQSSAALVSSMSSLASLTGLGTGTLHDPNDLYLALLQSHRVDEGVVKDLNLQSVYKSKTLSEARTRLLAASKFVSEKGGMISITVSDSDRNRAALIANTMVKELHSVNNDLVIGEAGVRRTFFTQQLALEKDRLTDAEIALRQVQETTGAVSPGGQTGVAISQMASLQAQILSREVQLDAMHTSSTDQNPDVIKLNGEIAGLRDQLQRMQNSSAKRVPGDILLSPRVLAADQLEVMRKQREVQYHTLIFDLIARQFEAARLDEAKAAPVIQVLDAAEAPEKKSGPYRALWCLIGTVLGFVYSVIRVISGYVYQRVSTDDLVAQKLGDLRRAASLRST